MRSWKELLKLQIFLFSSPLQDLFFFTRQKTISLLINLIEYFVDSFLSDVWDFFIRLCSRHIIVKLVFFIFWFFLFLWIKQITEPVEKLIHPVAAIAPPSQHVNKKIANACRTCISQVGRQITISHTREIE